MRVPAKLMMAALCPLGKLAVMGKVGASAMSNPKTLSHVARQTPRVMHVTCITGTGGCSPERPPVRESCERRSRGIHEAPMSWLGIPAS